MPRSRPNTALIYALVRVIAPPTMQSTHSQLTAPPRITLYYNSSLFSVAFSALSISFRPILRQTELIVRLNIPQHLSFARMPDKPVRLPSSHASSLRYAATFRLRALFASCSRAFRQVRGSFCRRTAVRRPAPTLSAPSIPASGAGERISLCSRFMWNMRLVIRQNLNIYRDFARLCIFIHCVIACFSPMRLIFPSLRSFPHCLSAAGDRASAPLRRFYFRAPHRRPACRFCRRSFAFRFSAVVPPSFLIFRSLFASCPMAHRKLFVCFSLTSAFRAFPSMIRSASSPVFD